MNSIGYDGIWVSPEGETIIAEVKTTDAYRISLETIAGYRGRLSEAGQIGARATILIVVGREDTGELEAQVRGSRHAWDMRLISVDSLVKLVQLKENAEGPETGRKIRSLLVPREYTRLDDMIDVMFTTAKDVETAAVLSASEEEQPDEAAGPSVREKGRWEFTDSRVLEDKRLEIVAALATREGTTLIKVSPALYRSPDHGRRAAFTLSKKYQRKNLLYWYAYHPRWDEFLGNRENSYLVLGCIDRSEAFAIPTNKLHPLLNDLYTNTNTEGVYYWHIQLTENNEGDTALILPKRNATFSLAEFTLKL